jgi:hypothetical protein
MKFTRLDFLLVNGNVTPNRNLFEVDKRTGLVFTKARLTTTASQQTKLFKLNVRVRGMIDETKVILFDVDVFVHIKEKAIVSQSQLDDDEKANEIVFTDLEATFGGEQNMVDLVLGESQIQRRFKIVHQQEANVCEANWYSSSLACGLREYFCSHDDDYQLKMIAYDLATFNLLNVFNVKIYSNRTECQTSLTQEIDLVKEIQVYDEDNDNDNEEQSLGFIYEMLNAEHGLRLNPRKHRILFDDDDDAVGHRIFKINSKSSELKLSMSLIGNKTAASFSLTFKVVSNFFLHYYKSRFKPDFRFKSGLTLDFCFARNSDLKLF